jgi:hypothetical protein
MSSAGSAADGDLRPAAENASKTNPMRRDGCAGAIDLLRDNVTESSIVRMLQTLIRWELTQHLAQVDRYVCGLSSEALSTPIAKANKVPMPHTRLQQRDLAIIEQHDGLFVETVNELAQKFQPWDLHTLADQAAKPEAARMFRHAALLAEQESRAGES